MNSNELRLFVSSTFRDLQPEREQLVKKIFPRIRKECRERGVEFTEIDLRWGITEEESRTGKTIRICLEEIDRCRPYFIGIIGSRYGWIPGITEIEKDPEMIKDFPWLHDFAASERSIIEMEFAHGAVLQKNDSAFFYEQSLVKQTYQSDMTDPSQRADRELDDLKNRLQSTGLPYRKFLSPQELGEQVFKDILTILDRDFPKKAELTPLERERIDHEAYARNRRQSYIANPAYYDAFLKHVESDGPPLIIWGKSGLGKSALMAYLAHEYQSQNPDAFVVQHFIGAAEGSDPEDVMRQVMMEIKERYSLADAIPTDDNNLRDEFPVWLAKIKPEDKLVLLIDALNQLTGIAPEMHWMPEFFPTNVRLIVSTTADSLPLEQLRKRNWNELPLGPLTEIQRESISREFLKHFHKSLAPADLHTLSIDMKSSSPLFLRTVLEELRIFGSFSKLGEEMANYLASADERELFQKVLARMESDHGADAVRDVLSAIWASRHGLSESELMEITGMSRMALSELMIAMEYHLMQREGFHTFFHNFLREAIELRYLPDDAVQKAAHSRLAVYFAGREYGTRRMAEEPWQWQVSGEAKSLIAALADLDMVELFIESDKMQELVTYWVHADMDRIAATYADAYAKVDGSKTDAERQTYLQNIGKLLLAASRPMDATRYLEQSLDYMVRLHGEDAEACADAMKDLAEVQFELANYDAAKFSLDQALSIYQKMDSSVLRKAECLHSLSAVSFQFQNFAEAERLCLEAIALLPGQDYEQQDLLAKVLDNLSVIYFTDNKLSEAISSAEKALLIQRTLHGTSDRETLNTMNNLAVILRNAERYDEAEQMQELQLASLTAILGENSLKVALGLMNYAYTLRLRKKMVKAKEADLQALNIRLRHLPPDHPDVLTSQILVGYNEYLDGNLVEAEKIYRKYDPIRAKVLGEHHLDVQRGRKIWIEILNKLGREKEAAELQIDPAANV